MGLAKVEDVKRHRSLQGEISIWLKDKPAVIVAVSGGIDSMVLLDVCTSWYGKQAPQLLSVAHFNHKQRQCSGEDEELVRATAERLNLSFACESLQHHCPVGENVEAYLRRERYRFLESARLKQGAEHILTAHHVRDYAETLLMKLLGGRELRGIERSSRTGTVLRPMLGVSRLDIERHARSAGLLYKEDPSNRDQSFFRNWVRLNLLPLLESKQAAASELLFEAGHLIELESDFVQNQARERYQSDLAHFEWGAKEWLKRLIQIIQAEHPALGVRLVQWSLRNAPDGNWLAEGQKLPGIVLSHRVREFILGTATACDLERGYELRRRNGGVILKIKAD
jgi:tRNA(Ile)-lysidine synthetase-like protein